MIEENATGLLVDVEHEQIAAALLKLIRNSSLREKLGTAAKVESKRFSSKEMAKKYELIYKNGESYWSGK